MMRRGLADELEVLLVDAALLGGSGGASYCNGAGGGGGGGPGRPRNQCRCNGGLNPSSSSSSLDVGGGGEDGVAVDESDSF